MPVKFRLTVFIHMSDGLYNNELQRGNNYGTD